MDPPLERAGHRRAPGPRTRARRSLQRARRRQVLLRLVVGTVVAVGVVVAAGFLRNLGSKDRKGEGSSGGAAPATQQTWLWIGTLASDPSGEANWLTLFSWDKDKKKGFIMYVPRSTAVEIPGFGGGPEVVSKALALGGEPTLISSLSNLLGVRFDHYLKISDQGMQALFDKFGGVTIDVERKLSRKDPDGRVRVIFAEGRQHLDGTRIAEYLTYIDESGDEIARAVRHALVWSATLEQFREKAPEEFGRVFAESKDLFVTSAEGNQVLGFLTQFVSVGAEKVQFETLPVEAQAVQAGLQIYAPDAEAIERMVDRYLAGSRPGSGGSRGRRIQILNGNGVPGIGEEVANKLIPKGFKVVLGANANRFDYPITQIVIYSDSKQAEQIAGQIREALGVGEIVISRQKQTIVDVTIVVGRDYLNQR